MPGVHPATQAIGALRSLSGGPPDRWQLPIIPMALTIVVYALSKIQAIGHGWPSCNAHARKRVVDIQALQCIREEAVHFVPRISRAAKVDACRGEKAFTIRGVPRAFRALLCINCHAGNMQESQARHNQPSCQVENDWNSSTACGKEKAWDCSA